jgi:hypothetical protein
LLVWGVIARDINRLGNPEFRSLASSDIERALRSDKADLIGFIFIGGSDSILRIDGLGFAVLQGCGVTH